MKELHSASWLRECIVVSRSALHESLLALLANSAPRYSGGRSTLIHQTTASIEVQVLDGNQPASTNRIPTF